MFRTPLALCLAFTLLLPAQDQEPVFRTTTQLVEFTFVALDRNGKPVTDLRSDELIIEDKGKARDVAFFRFEGSVAATPSKPLPAGVFSNRTEKTGAQPRNLTAIVLDTLNTAPTDAMWVRAQTMRFLRGVAPETRIAVYLLGRQIGILHDFTDDMDSLRDRLKNATLALPPLSEVNMNTAIAEAEALLRMSDNDPILEQMLRDQIESDMLANEAARRRRLDMTLDMMESLGRHLAGIPGRKNLVWIGGGVSMLSITGAMGFGARGGVTSYETQVRDCAKRLAQQGITLYNVDAKGLTGQSSLDSSNSATTVPGGRRPFARQQQAETISVDPLPAATALASITGGRVVINTNDPMDAVRLAATDMKASYSAGFYLPGETDGKWRSLKLKTKRPGVKLLYREGYYAETASEKPLAWTREEWTSALLNPLGSSNIHLDGSCHPAEGEAPGTFAVQVMVDPTDLHFQQNGQEMRAFLEMGLGERGATGLVGFQRITGSLKVPAGAAKLPPPEENRLERSWKPREGAHSLRVIVRDTLTGRYGAIDMPLKRCAGQ